MAISNINVGGVDYPFGGGSGSGSAINASLYFVSVPKVEDSPFYNYERCPIIKCNKGEIKGTDVPVLGRNTNNRRLNKKDDNVQERYHGWIAHPEVRYLLHMELIHSDENYDFWHVEFDHNPNLVVTSPTGETMTFAEYQQVIADNGSSGLINLYHRSGIAIYRDGKRITEWIEFKYVVDGNDEVWLSRP